MATRKKSYDKLRQVRQRVMAATVRLSKLGGQGVLVPSGHILTAAHCIKWSGTGGMALGDHFIESVETRDGRTLTAEVYAAEPVADIAVLGPPDDQTFPDEWMAFDEFVGSVQGIPLYDRALNVGESLPVQVLTHKRKWVSATAIRFGMPGSLPGGTVCLRAKKKLEGGTSGGPVVDEKGRLIGLISDSGEDTWGNNSTFDGLMPLPWLALPRWLVDRLAPAGGRKQPT